MEIFFPKMNGHFPKKSIFKRIRHFWETIWVVTTDRSQNLDDAVLPVTRQIDSWQRANEKMAWGIREDEFGRIKVPPQITDKDRFDGFADVILSYGFGDYDVAPPGFSDFYDSLQMFCSQSILGLGVGNVDYNYPLFGIPTIRF